MAAQRLDIRELHWTAESEDHVEEHIDASWVEELIEGQDYVAFPNKEDHPPHFRMLIGKTPSGVWITTIIRPIDVEQGIWCPVTGWPATHIEQRKYAKAVGRSKLPRRAAKRR